MRDEIYNRWFADRGVKLALYLPSGETFEYYHDQTSFINLLKKVSLQIQKNWPNHISRYLELKRKIIRDAKDLALVVNKKNKKNILKAYQKYIASAYAFCEYIWSPWVIIHILEPEFYQKFPNNEIVSSLEEPIEYLKMQKEAIRLSPKQLQAKFGWLNVYNPYDKPYNEAYFKKIKDKITAKEVKNQIKHLNKNKDDFKKFVQTLSKKWKLKAQIIHKYAFLKTDRIDAWKKTMVSLTELCKYLSTLIPGMTAKDASFLSVHEVISILEGKINIGVKKIKLRSNNKAAYLLTQKEEIVSYSQNNIKELKSLLLAKQGGRQGLTGVTACKGIARGMVVIINHSKDVKKIKRGNIFVARYTFPSFTPFMKISAAIVTDEGGLTSHAAIVARELGIPCIIGTKIGTKFFKDGDMVEVDANKGLIKTIN